MGYEPVAKARFTVEQTDDGEQISLKAKRQIFPMLFLPVWLAGWTAGGLATINQILDQFEPFLAIWLCGWAVAWIAVVASLAWLFAGSETLRAVRSDLEIAQRALGLSRRWSYQGTQIRNLRVADQQPGPFRSGFQIPFLRLGREGSIKFDYGARTIYAAPGLDEAEAKMVIERLCRGLPASARSTG